MLDGGYDVADYRDVDPLFGTVDEGVALVEAAHEHGLRVLLDIVPNHSSDRHPWFVEALAAGPGSHERERYVFRPGSGPDGAEPPNAWMSVFGGPAWERVTEPDGTPGEWYLHLFAPEQPDFNWENPEVHADFEETLRFWFDRGVDGFRIDVAHSLFKQPGLPDAEDMEWPRNPVEVDGVMQRSPWQPHPFWDRDEVHDVYRAWRELADSYDPPRVFVGEAWVDEPERLARYVRGDELHTTFNFPYLVSPFDARSLQHVAAETLDVLDAVGAPSTWVLSNHDVTRHVSRYARDQQTHAHPLQGMFGRPADLDLGVRRARAAVLLTLALPGGAYVYQGEELGLPEVEDLPEDVLDDPTWERSGHTERGRDGCRVPIPWSGTRTPYGFSPAGSDAAPWLPQPADWARLTVEAESGDPGSMLELYRSALRLRRETPGFGDGSLTWLDLPEGVLGFTREPGLAVVVNVSAALTGLPEGYDVLLTSDDLVDGGLPAATAAWLKRH
jgi:alpha-glucosidase